MEAKSKRVNKSENMNPSHMKCYLIHFTGVLIEGGTVCSPHRGKNLYSVHCSCERSQTAMLRGKLTVCLNCVPPSTNDSQKFGLFRKCQVQVEKKDKKETNKLIILRWYAPYVAQCRSAMKLSEKTKKKVNFRFRKHKEME